MKTLDVCFLSSIISFQVFGLVMPGVLLIGPGLILCSFFIGRYGWLKMFLLSCWPPLLIIIPEAPILWLNTEMSLRNAFAAFSPYVLAMESFFRVAVIVGFIGFFVFIFGFRLMILALIRRSFVKHKIYERCMLQN